MKKYFYFLSLLLILTSCTEDVRFNNPAFQALKDNTFWRTQTYKAYLNANGSMVVEGNLGYEKVTLQTESAVEQSYSLGVNELSKATYENTLPSVLSFYSTGTDFGNGQIVITDYDAENKTISGTFKFKAINRDEGDIDNPQINFTEGVFYKVPVEVSDIAHHL